MLYVYSSNRSDRANLIIPKDHPSLRYVIGSFIGVPEVSGCLALQSAGAGGLGLAEGGGGGGHGGRVPRP